MEQSRAVKTFDALFAELSDRARTRPDGSGTVAALDGGVHGEIGQLLYWTQVLMISRGLTLDDVYQEL